MVKEISEREAVNMFLDQCRVTADTWINSDRCETVRERVEGAIFSIMVMIDGNSGGFPAAIDLVLRPHVDDKQYCIDNKEDWIVDGQCFNQDYVLHEMIFKTEENKDAKVQNNTRESRVLD